MTPMTTQPTPRDLADAILVSGLDDWVAISEAYGLVITLGGTRVQSGLLVFEALRKLLEDGYVEIGTVTESGFVSAISTANNAVARVAEYTNRYPDGNYSDGYEFWFNNTPAGNRYAMDLAAK